MGKKFDEQMICNCSLSRKWWWGSIKVFDSPTKFLVYLDKEGSIDFDQANVKKVTVAYLCNRIDDGGGEFEGTDSHWAVCEPTANGAFAVWEINLSTLYSDPPSPEMVVEKYYWWCPTCKCEVGSQNVTYQEFHDACGTHVEAKPVFKSSPEMVCPDLEQWEKAAEKGTSGDMVWNILRDWRKSLKVPSPEPPEKVGEIMCLECKEFLGTECERCHWNMKKLSLKLQQAGWKSPEQMAGYVNRSIVNAELNQVAEHSRQQALKEFAFKVNEWLDKYDWEMKDLRKFISTLPKE